MTTGHQAWSGVSPLQACTEGNFAKVGLRKAFKDTLLLSFPSSLEPNQTIRMALSSSVSH